MGILKKIFKPVSKVLDKIIPNELKPILPYAAAAFPMLYSGGLGGQTLMSQMIRRGMMSGALNIGGQLAQEGSEGDINLLSAGLGALSGVMTAPGRPGVSMKDIATDTVIKSPGIPSAAEYFTGLGKGNETAMGQIYSGLGKTSKFMSSPGLTKYSIPAAQGTADLMYAEGKRLEDDEDEEVVEEAGYTDAAYRAAIRKSMEAYGATEEEIIAAIEAAGYRSGGRVGFKDAGLAGLMNPQQSMDKEETQWLSKVSPTKEVDTIHRIYEEGGNEALQAYLQRNPDLTDKYIINADAMSGELFVMPNKLHPDNMDMENIIMIDTGNNVEIMNEMFKENKAKGGIIPPPL